MKLFKRKQLTQEEKRKRMSRAFIEWYCHQSGWTDHREVIKLEKELGLL